MTQNIKIFDRMKARHILILAMTVMALSSCRKEATQMLNPDSITTSSIRFGYLSDQVKTIWEGINTSYVFWDVDTTDWDAKRDELYHWAEKYDSLLSHSEDSMDVVAAQNDFGKIFAGMRDQHMAAVVVNNFVGTTDYKPYFIANPNSVRKAAMKAHPRVPDSLSRKAIENMAAKGTMSVSDVKYGYEIINGENLYVYSCLLNGCVAYIRMSGYLIGNESSHKPEVAEALFGHFKRVKEMHDAGTLNAIILDNRGNGGGYASDTRWMAGLYVDKVATFQYLRTKTGLGRYDFSPEQPMTVSPYSDSPYYVGDLGENVKYVVLQDINSLSMGEVTGNQILQLPQGYTIGEITGGGHGPLTPKNYDVNWSGSFGYDYGSSGGGKYTCPLVYTSAYSMRTWDWEKGEFVIQEGIGLKPQLEINLDVEKIKNGYDNQLAGALEYIGTEK